MGRMASGASKPQLRFGSRVVRNLGILDAMIGMVLVLVFKALPGNGIGSAMNGQSSASWQDPESWDSWEDTESAWQEPQDKGDGKDKGKGKEKPTGPKAKATAKAKVKPALKPPVTPPPGPTPWERFQASRKRKMEAEQLKTVLEDEDEDGDADVSVNEDAAHGALSEAGGDKEESDSSSGDSGPAVAGDGKTHFPWTDIIEQPEQPETALVLKMAYQAQCKSYWAVPIKGDWMCVACGAWWVPSHYYRNMKHAQRVANGYGCPGVWDRCFKKGFKEADVDEGFKVDDVLMQHGISAPCGKKATKDKKTKKDTHANA